MVNVEVSRKGKPWYKSKTMWTGILESAGGFALLLAEELATGGALTITGIITILLRVVTKEEISFKKD